MKNTVDLLAEWAVWAHLDREKKLELILLKGHLLLERILEVVLLRFEIKDIDSFSFFKKISEFEKCCGMINEDRSFIILSLRNLNKLRNRLAHDFDFEVESGDLRSWAVCVMNNLKGEKYSKYTFRTKIVHAFSILSGHVLATSKTFD